MAPIIKVIANSFLIQGLLSLFFGQLFWNFLAFLNLWDPTTADSYLVFENPSTHCWGMRKIVGFFWWKMSNQGFQRAIFNFFQCPRCFWPRFHFFYFFCLISVELHPNDQKLSKCSFGNLFWHQNYQTRFRFDPIYWTLPAHTLLFWWFWSQGKACKWYYNLFLVIWT